MENVKIERMSVDFFGENDNSCTIRVYIKIYNKECLNMKVKVIDKADGSSNWFKKGDIYEVKEGILNTYEVIREY